MSRRWTPSLLLRLSALIHLGSVLALLWQPQHWLWLLALLAANHLLLTVAGLLPRCPWLGPTLTRLPAAAQARGEVALTIDDGPDPEVTPQVLDLLDAAGVKATFFCIGWRARAHPALCREIVARGHRVENHGDAHAAAFSTFGPGRMRADILAAQTSLSEITGQAPLFFRATAGLRNPFLDPVLHRLGLQLAAWTRRAYDTRTGDPAVVLARLSRDLQAGDILLLHDGHAARTAQGEAVILAVLPLLLAQLAALKLRPVTLAQACS